MGVDTGEGDSDLEYGRFPRLTGDIWSYQHPIMRAFVQPKPSRWRCHLFGSFGLGGITWEPNEGEVPNWFWRKMQYLAFGNRWVKDK